MKLSTKGRYGARAILELSLRYGSGPVMVREIAESQHVSERYLEQILNTLRAAELVRSTRGARGGYELAKPPSEITMGDVLRVLEGPMDIVSCTRGDDCEYKMKCATYLVWKEVKEAIEKVLDSMTLEELTKKQHQLNKQMTIDYTI